MTAQANRFSFFFAPANENEATLANEAADLALAEGSGNLIADMFAERAPEGIGAFENEEGVFIVKKSRESNRLYAKRLVPAQDGGKPAFVYAPGAIYRLRETHRMTRERGEELSVQIGACCVCGRTLTVKKSVAAGIGPVCVKYFGGSIYRAA